LVSAASRLTVVLIATLVLTGSTTADHRHARPILAPAPPVAEPVLEAGPVTTSTALVVPAALDNPGLGLRDGPSAVPLELKVPSLDVAAPVVGVGITETNVMDAPMGPADDPAWQQAFWYRGSAVPGALSTALIAGHVDDPLGRPGVFAHLDSLRPGDPIVVHDTRSGLDVRFAVTELKIYSLEETADPAVLNLIYGAGPVQGTWPQPSADGLAHLTLITCGGTFRNGTHDHRVVVYATRSA
jgi:sortase (surface protein transpeptidase)